MFQFTITNYFYNDPAITISISVSLSLSLSLEIAKSYTEGWDMQTGVVLV